MPLYEYLCPNCNHKFELMRPMAQAAEAAQCPSCGGSARRLFSTFAASSKGSEGEFSLGGNACSTCSANSCSTCSLSR